MSKYVSLFSQFFPFHPASQLQVYPFTWSKHVPPFLHGLLSHSSMSKRIWIGKHETMSSLYIPHVWLMDRWTKPLTNEKLVNGFAIPTNNINVLGEPWASMSYFCHRLFLSIQLYSCNHIHSIGPNMCPHFHMDCWHIHQCLKENKLECMIQWAIF